MGTKVFIDTYYGGHLSLSDNVYATAQAGAGVYTQSTLRDVGQIYYNPGYIVYRLGSAFDTSSLGAGVTITSATLSLYGWSDDSDTDFDITIVSGADLADKLVDADYQDLLNDTTSFGSLSSASFVEGAWNVITLNPTGLAAISKTGATRFGIRSSRDISATTPTGFEEVQFEGAFVGNHPAQLSVTYTGGFIPKVFIM